MQPGLRAVGHLHLNHLRHVLNYSESWTPHQLFESKSPGMGPKASTFFMISLGDLDMH